CCGAGGSWHGRSLRGGPFSAEGSSRAAPADPGDGSDATRSRVIRGGKVGLDTSKRRLCSSEGQDHERGTSGRGAGTGGARLGGSAGGGRPCSTGARPCGPVHNPGCPLVLGRLLSAGAGRGGQATTRGCIRA